VDNHRGWAVQLLAATERWRAEEVGGLQDSLVTAMTQLTAAERGGPGGLKGVKTRLMFEKGSDVVHFIRRYLKE
jgi:hypothetical protein